MKPRIGITAYVNYRLPPHRHMLNTPYVRAVVAAGATPVVIPMDEDAGRAAEYIGLLDGLLVPGGEDVSPLLYGEEPAPQVNYAIREKDEFELALIRHACEAGMPIFGICRGMQLLNVCFGGSLIQDLPAAGATICHQQAMELRSQLTHSIRTEGGSLIEQLLGPQLCVNSYHHQAVGRVAEGFVVTARSPDDIPEAFECADRGIYAVQWHPEELWSGHPQFMPLFTHLTERAVHFAANRS